MKIRIVQVPYDSGHKDLRQGRGPAHFIGRHLDQALEKDGHQVAVARIDTESAFPTEIGTAFELNRLLSAEIKTSIANSQFPVVLSGNCNSCLGTIAGLNSADLGVVWFDAHGEFNTPETTRSGFLDGMPLAMATGRCWKAMLETIPGFIPVQEENVILVGATDLDPEEERQLQQSRVKVIAAKEAEPDHLLKEFENALKALRPRVSGIYLHIDMDALSIAEGAANHFGASGGLQPEIVEAAAGLVKQYFRLRAGALASYDPAFDSGGGFLAAGIRCIREIVSESTCLTPTLQKPEGF